MSVAPAGAVTAASSQAPADQAHTSLDGAAAMARYLDVVFGEATGYAHLATADGWQRLVSGKLRPHNFTPVSFAYPAERDRLVAEIRQAVAVGWDVWLCPYLLAGTERTKGTAVDRRLVHADVDGAVDLDAVRELGGFAVASGRTTDGGPHAHVYLRLAEPVDVDTHTRLCRALSERLGGDRGKVSDNDLLRPPGTVNGKPGGPSPVRWLVEPDAAKVWAPAELAAVLGASAESTAGVTGGITVDAADLPERVREALNVHSVPADRSADTFRVVAACLDAGLSLDATRAAVASRTDLAERLAARHDDDVLTCWLRALEERQQRIRGRDLDFMPPQTTVAPAAETVRSDPAGPAGPWCPVDLAGVVAGLLDGTIARPVPSVGRCDDGAGLFYPRAVNGLCGASGSGKSWTALLAAAQQLATGAHVVYIDLESNAADVVGRLLDLGADPAAVVARFHYLNPDVRLNAAAAAAVFALIEEATPTLVVIDSTGESMAIEGDRPNEDDDCARWFHRLAEPVAKRGPAVVVVDHMTKADDGALWPIGSQRKRAAISGAQYVQTAVQPFAKGQPGSAKIVCAKDRNGTYRQGQRVAILDVSPGENGTVRMALRAAADGADGERKPFRPTTLMERISVLLESAAGPTTLRGVLSAVRGREQDKTAALRTLVAEGYVSETPGPRGAKLHTSVAAYRQADDPESDRYESGRQSPPPDRLTVCLPKGSETGDRRSPSPGDGAETVGDGGTVAVQTKIDILDEEQDHQ